VNRINPLTYDADETMESLITAVPFGVPDDPPVHRRQVLKGVVPGIGTDDKVILWGGGVYNWFDPLTLVRAVQQLHARHPDVRLFFLGMKHPNPDVPDMRMAWETRQLSDNLGLTDKVVFFNEEWVPYDERQNYLLESDLGVSTHLDHVETAFSFRTRILDYLWAGLPVVATGGDSLGQAIDGHGLGVTVPPGDVAALEAALEAFLFDEERVGAARASVAAFAPSMTWSRSLEPLLRFCRSPQRAPDLVDRLGEADVEARSFLVSRRPSLRGDLAKARLFFAEGGSRHVLRKASGRLSRIVGERRARH
jgi:glycosyltransferase involved in cell wall biosynthesis